MSNRPLSRSSNSSAESFCPICKDERSTDYARLMPCGHEFDLECIKIVIEDYILRDKCPLCRAKPTEVRFAFTESGAYSTWIPGTRYPGPRNSAELQPRRQDGQHPGSRNSAELAPSMQGGQQAMIGAQVRRMMEIRRLRDRPIYEPEIWTIPPEQVHMIEGQNYIVVTRHLALALTQRNVGTATVLRRGLTIQTIPIFSQLAGSLDLHMPAMPAKVQKARREFQAALVQARAGDSSGVLVIEIPKKVVMNDEKGLMVSTSKVGKVTSNSTTLFLEWTTSLEEILPENAWRAHLEGGRTSIGGFEYRVRERAVRLARMEIQGALLTVKPYAYDFVELEEATTGLLEAVSAENLECEYCPQRHRNGDCLLPWTIQ